MTCAGCGRAFTKSGMAAQSVPNPKLCVACSIHEACFHDYHAPRERCLDKYLGNKKEATHGRAS